MKVDLKCCNIDLYLCEYFLRKLGFVVESRMEWFLSYMIVLLWGISFVRLFFENIIELLILIIRKKNYNYFVVREKNILYLGFCNFFSMVKREMK